MKRWEIRRLSNQSAEILLYEEIDDVFGVDAKSFIEDLNALDEDVDRIDLRINSPGGSVFQGVAIYNALKRHKAFVNVTIDGVALSMASGIAMAGDNVEMCENGIMMMHNPHAVAAGDADEMKRTANMLAKTRDALVKAYAAKSGQSDDQIRELMAEETWMTAEEALELGFIDAINECKQMAASYDVGNVSVPSRLRGAFNSLLVKEPLKMANEPNAGAPQPATLQELEAINSDPTFIVDCLKDQVTIDNAKSKLIADQASKIKDLQNIVADFQAKNGAKEDTLRRQGTSVIPDPSTPPQQQKPQQPAPQPAEPQPQPAPQPSVTVTPPDPAAQWTATGQQIGNQPVPVATQTTHTVEYDNNPLAFFKRAKAEVKAELQATRRKFTVNDILREVHNKYPGLEQAMQDQAGGKS